MGIGDVTVNRTSVNFRDGAIFDGVDDEVILGTWTQPEFLNSMTFSGWVYINTEGNIDTIIGSNGATNSFFLRHETGGTTINCWIKNIANTTWTNAMAGLARTWMHWALVVELDSNQLTLYINGVSKGAKTMNDEWTNTGDLQLGQRGTNQDPLDGKTSDYQVHNRALTQAEITSLANNRDVTNGLIHRWILRADYKDSVGSNDGTNNGSRLATVEDQVAKAIADARTTANDQHLLIPAGKQNLSFLDATVEEAP